MIHCRRARWVRSHVEDHRSSFEMLQADLESTVETLSGINCLLSTNLCSGWQSNVHRAILSDVCARRRLRASQAQIQQASRAARQKRVELEALLIAYNTMKEQMQRSERDSGRRASTGSMGSASRSRSVNNSALSRRMTPQSTLRTINRYVIVAR